MQAKLSLSLCIYGAVMIKVLKFLIKVFNSKVKIKVNPPLPEFFFS